MEKNYDNAAADIAYVRSELSRLVKDPELSAILGDEAVERMSKWDSVIGQKMDQPFSLMVIGAFTGAAVGYFSQNPCRSRAQDDSRSWDKGAATSRARRKNDRSR